VVLDCALPTRVVREGEIARPAAGTRRATLATVLFGAKPVEHVASHWTHRREVRVIEIVRRVAGHSELLHHVA
jgi:hypothetical protein